MACFFGALLLGLFLPVYTDEIGWRFQERAGFDGVDKMYSDVCGPNSLAAPPWFMWPARTFSAVFNGAFAAPLYVRLSGIGYAVLWGVLLTLLIRRVVHEPRMSLAVGAIAFGLLALANTPLLLVLSRPEQPIILCATAAALLATPRQDSGDRARRASVAWLRAAAVAALAAIAFSYHLKALFLLPAFVACALLTSGGRATLLPRVMASTAIIALAAIAARYWLLRLQCPDDPVLRAEYARNSLGAMLTDVHGPGGFIKLAERLVANVGLFRYVLLARPEPYPLSFWLAQRQATSLAAFVWSIVLCVAWAAVLAAALASIALAAWRSWRAGRVDGRAMVAATLLAAVFGWSATQLVSNFYEGAFVLPLLALAIVHAIAAGAVTGPQRLVNVLLGAGLALAAPASVAITARIWAPSFARAWRQSGYVEEQPFSLSARGYAPIAARVRAAASACGFPPLAHARGVVLDELTYFPLMRSRLPQHWLGVFGGWKGSITDPIAYLRGRRSDGILVACGHLPTDLRARAREIGGVCCLAPPGW